MRAFGLIVAAAVGLVAIGFRAAGPAHGAGPDLEFGRYLATECMTCHRKITQAAMSGLGAGGIPDIYGMAEQTFVQVIKAYRARQLENPVMQNIAGRLKDEEIEALAAFFAQAQP